MVATSIAKYEGLCKSGMLTDMKPIDQAILSQHNLFPLFLFKTFEFVDARRYLDPSLVWFQNTKKHECS